MLQRAEISNFNHRVGKTIKTNYTVTNFDEVLFIDATSGNITITLPDAIGNKNLYISIKKIDSSGNTITITPINSQTFDGQSTQVISSQNDVYELMSDGNNWQSVSIPTTVAGGALPITGGTLTGVLNITPAAVTTGVQTGLYFTGANNTGLTVSTEVSDVILNFARVVQWTTGNIVNQRAMRIANPTYSFVGASTITNAATLAIAGAPIAGTNATITNSMALWVQAGLTRLDGGLQIGDATNIILGNTTGTKIGTATTQKLGFYNTTPIVQRSGASEAAVATTGSSQTTPYGYTTSAQADGIVTLLNEIRATLVALGLFAGA